MADPKKIPKLIPLDSQIFRGENEIIAIRKNKLLYTTDLRKHVIAIYHALIFSEEEYWALAMQDSFNFVAGMLALFYAGKHPILLNPFHKEMKHHYQALLTDDNTINHELFSKHSIINISQLNINNEHHMLPRGFQSQTLTLFTSGSTGLPKPIIKTIYQLEKESEILTAYFGSLANQIFISSVKHYHMYGLTFKIMLALTNRATFVCEAVHYQEQFSRYNNKQIIYITTPSIIKTLDSKIKNVVCSKVISAAGFLSYQATQHNLECLGVLPDEIYGSSETGVIATRKQQKENTPWQLFPKMKLTYDGKQSVLSSPLLHDDEPLSDEIELIGAQNFYLKGRKDKIIKISEKRVSLTYIENILEQQPEIIRAKVIPIEQKDRTILAAIILLSECGKQKQQHLTHFQISQYFRQQLKDKLSLATIPKKWRFVEQLPINEQGKSTYIELKALFDKF